MNIISQLSEKFIFSGKLIAYLTATICDIYTVKRELERDIFIGRITALYKV